MKTQRIRELLRKWPRTILLVPPCVAVFLIAGCGIETKRPTQQWSAPQTKVESSTRRVTFVQMTDPHIFDAGGARHGEGVTEKALDNRAAFNWAIRETNRLLLAERRPIDFVAITSDFGLENLNPPHWEYARI